MLSIENAISAAPDDFQLYMVYADSLLERGDPRGELIRLQQSIQGSSPLERARIRAAMGRVFREHSKTFYGKVASALDLEWRWGFIRSARVQDWPYSRMKQIKAIAALLKEPSARFLVELDVARLIEGERDYQALFDLLAQAPSSLRCLSVAAEDEGPSAVLGSLSLLNQTAAQLEELTVNCEDASLSGLMLPKLHTLRLVARPHADEKAHFQQVRLVCQSQMGKLKGVLKKLKEEAKKGDKAERAKTFGNYGVALWRAHDWVGAEQAYLMSGQCAREQNSPRDEAISLMNLCHLFTWRTQPLRAVEYGERGLAILDAHGMVVMAAEARKTLADALLAANAVERCRTLVDEAFPVLKKAKSQQGCATLHFISADLELNVGRSAEAIKHVHAGLELQKGNEQGVGLAVAHSKLAFAAFLDGDLKLAMNEGDKARVLFERVGFNHGWPQAARGLFFHSAGRFDESIESLKEALSLAKKAADIPLQRRVLFQLAAAQAAAGKVKVAFTTLERGECLEQTESVDPQTREIGIMCRQLVSSLESGSRPVGTPQPICYDARAYWEFAHGVP